MNAFIFHGTAGHPEENWFPWLRTKLESIGCPTIVPQFPTPENQTLDRWFETLKPFRSEIGSDTILFGHSLGGTFLLRLLEDLKTPVRTSVIVAAPIGIPPIKNWDEDQPFIGKPFRWDQIRATSQRFIVIYSDNDPLVGLENGRLLSQRLGTELTLIPGAGHFNAAAGYLEFPRLLAEISSHLPEAAGV
jgi:predicted alpha/beta hydrolase family esterase